MRRALLIIGLLAVLAPSAGAAPAQPGILYSVDAKGPAIVQSGSELRLTVPANAPATWFADRPARRAGTTNALGLAKRWGASGFAKDPPNAALVLTHRGVERTHVVTLLHPRHANGRVSFAIRAVPNATEAGHAHGNDLAAGRYGRARIFIDDAAYPPCPSTISSALTCLATGDQVVVVTAPGLGSPLQVDACVTPAATGAAIEFAYLGILAAVPTACPTPTTVVQRVDGDILGIATPPGVVMTLFVVPVFGGAAAPGAPGAPGARHPIVVR